MKQFTPGGIRCPEAMAQGKMLDHSWWYGQMRGKITPSDIDMVVESSGCFLVCEISRDAESLQEISTGQRLLLQRFAAIPGTHCVAILRHGLFSHSKPIDTANDIKSATVYFDLGTRKVVLNEDEWREFGKAWTFDAKKSVDTILRPKLTN